MTTAKDISTQIGRYVAAKAQADRLYAEVKELEFEILAALREEFPDQWSEYERTGKGFKAYGLEVPTGRSYDAQAVRAEFGEERPDLVTREEKIVEKVNGRKMTEMWKQLDLVPRLEKCLLPVTPKLKISK